MTNPSRRSQAALTVLILSAARLLGACGGDIDASIQSYCEHEVACPALEGHHSDVQACVKSWDQTRDKAEKLGCVDVFQKFIDCANANLCDVEGCTDQSINVYDDPCNLL